MRIPENVNVLFMKGGKPYGAGLSLRIVIDKRGRKVSQWVKNTQAHPTQEIDAQIGLFDATPDLPETILVDGVNRPTMSAEGRPIHYTENGVRNFWRWIDGLQRERVARATEPNEEWGGFAQDDRRDSPSRYFFDEQGRPRIFYHGTDTSIEAFDLDHPARKDSGWLGRGVYLSSDEQLAETYANLKGGYDHQVIMPMYVGITNPYVFSVEEKQRISRLSKEAIARLTERAIAHGYDGGVLEFGDGSLEVVAFSPAAVKSVPGNNGDFGDSALIAKSLPVRVLFFVRKPKR